MQTESTKKACSFFERCQKKYIETDRTVVLKNHGNQCKTVVQMQETVLSFQGFS